MTENALSFNPTNSIPAAPVVQASRIDSLDILRGIAVFGILLMNISAFGLVWQAYGNPYAAGGTDPLNLRLFDIMNVGVRRDHARHLLDAVRRRDRADDRA